MWESESQIEASCIGTSVSSQTGKRNRSSRNGRISPRPAVIKTTWLDFTEDVNNMFDSADNQNTTTIVAEHTEWKSETEGEGDESNMSAEHLNIANLNNNYQDVYAHNLDERIISDEEEEDNKLFTLTPKIKSKSKRVFQKFWCAAEDDDEDLQELPRPDGYRLRSSGIQKRNNKSSLRRRLLGMDNGMQLVASSELVSYTNDERGGIRRRPKTWDILEEEEEEDTKKDEKFYAPKRPPPILDFLMVVTSFCVAAVLAYYTAELL